MLLSMFAFAAAYAIVELGKFCNWFEGLFMPPLAVVFRETMLWMDWGPETLLMFG
jgi:hypothetical protein